VANAVRREIHLDSEFNPVGAARMIGFARAFAGFAGLLGAYSLLGYALDVPLLVQMQADLQKMSPLTATSVLLLAGATYSLSWNRQETISAIAAGLAATIAAASMITRMITGDERLNFLVGRYLHLDQTILGRTSVATALSIIVIAIALTVRRRRPGIADSSAGVGLTISGAALLGYLYGVNDLYAVAIFDSMALPTAGALFSLSLSALTVEPRQGWAVVVGSNELGGSAARRQLCFIAVPVAAGWVLLAIAETHYLGPAMAIAMLVIITIIPLAVLVLRDGRILNELDREKQAKLALHGGLTRQMEEQLAQQAAALQQESTERAKAEAAMYQAQRMEAVGQLTGGIAHDFNNLMMAIRGNLELLQRRLPPDEERLHRYLENAAAATDKGAKVTAQLLAFSRSQRPDIRPVKLDPVLDSALQLIGTSLGPSIEITMNLRTANAWVMTDPDQLELAILNLAVNARDAMPEGGHLRIETSASHEAVAGEANPAAYASIRVTDEGTGMTLEVAAQAVEPFFTTKDRGKGTGLGLAQVDGFVRQCGGDLRITSLPGAGTAIEMLLPYADPQQVPVGPLRTETITIPAGGAELLVIDDDNSVRAVIADALRTAGFNVVEAENGETGLALLDRVRPVAAVIDFLMPGMNGAEVARLARQRHPDLPIVFVSGYADTVALEAISGAVVLRKPFDFDDLDRALTSVLSGKPPVMPVSGA
jgi:signal transduction histidine kinase/ActR/RegA family two-component response regulator